MKKKLFNRFAGIFVLCISLGCTRGDFQGVRVLGKVQGTGDPVFAIPGEDRMLYVIVSQRDTLESNVLKSVLYGGRSLKILSRNRGLPENGERVSMEVWYLEEEALRNTDSSDLEFFFEQGDPAERGQTFQSASILLQGVDQKSPVISVHSSASNQANKVQKSHLEKGSVVLLGVSGPSEALSEGRKGFTEILGEKGKEKGDGLWIYARFISEDEEYSLDRENAVANGPWRMTAFSVRAQ